MKPFDLFVTNGTVVTAHGEYRGSIAVVDGRIAAIVAPGVDLPAVRTIDARGRHVLPGLWHVHCHFREPGHTYKEDFESGSRAAAAGGIAFCIDMTNNTPHPTTLETFEMKKAAIAPKAHVDYAIYGGGLYPKTCLDLGKAGAIGIKIFNTRHVKEVYPYITELGVVDHGILYELYEAIAETGLVGSVHHDDTEWCKRLTFRDYINPGKVENKYYMECYERGYMYGHGMVAGLASSLYYARLTKLRLHVLHLGVMPVGAYEMLRHAKFDLKQDVTAELEAASLFMSREQAERVGPFAYLWAHSPEAGWTSLRDGVADMLVGEHAPHSVEDVEPGWEDNFSVPLGITGAQEFVPLMLNAVNEGRMTLQDIARFCALQPAQRFGLYPRKGALELGADADITIVDLARETVLRKEDMHSRAGHTSWEGMRVRGMPVATIVRGQVVMEEARIVGEPGLGRFTPGILGRDGGPAPDAARLHRAEAVAQAASRQVAAGPVLE
ncbi:Dihydropyrimidinase [Methylobacterium sp. 4-46]|uniref:dihydroorotase n=1 Tax=unclassified Methylobacterium TaxID=2615210 RepID=UPI000152D967|nr:MULTISPECIES: dihydroorotase family protein [Methylobacterium]ACA19931.1 Dihydropyrimidinase [Methylobacterium sp. 4-46]WFT79116.1 dihydroorotase family protein [Methylobacterium nodulans]